MRALALSVLSVLALPAAGPKPPARMMATAPPVIPHRLDPDSACTDCHGPVRKDGTPGVPHKVGGFCQSCHLPQTRVAPWKPNARWDADGLAKLPTGMRGARSTPAAPPAIPHATAMREHCTACHGPEPRPGMRKNPHPQRAQCRACHLPG